MTIASFDPVVTGHNSAFMAQAYFSTTLLDAILPRCLSIPHRDEMARHFPETELKADQHPFMLSACHGSDIHDVYTKVNIPEQEEIMCVFPVMYTHDNGVRYLCSYVPLLYLDSLLGVLGGLYFGLRKEYHRGMQHGRGPGNTSWWAIKGILDATFEAREGQDMDKLPRFYEQMFCSPFVTVSYPLPVSKMLFYQASVVLAAVCGARAVIEWKYAEQTVKSQENGSAVFADYSFGMSRPRISKQFPPFRD